MDRDSVKISTTEENQKIKKGKIKYIMQNTITKYFINVNKPIME